MLPKSVSVALSSNRDMKNRIGEATLTALIPATSRMVELMETAAVRLMKAHLDVGETSVAVAMNVTYAAASLRHPHGESSMRAVASYSGISGKLHRFRINAFDESGLIGTAEHTRAVVAERRLVRVASQPSAELRLV
jgi:predicted thioesterase